MYDKTIRDIINELRPGNGKAVTNFITMQCHGKGRPPEFRDAHDILMAYVDITLLALFVVRELKAQKVEYETVARNMKKIIGEHPKILRWLWDNEDCYFCRITKNDLIVKEIKND